MRWSYSASRSFRECQRQWFFKNIVASARATEPFRRRVYLLSKLQSVSAWRGKIVDNVISKTLIPGLNLPSLGFGNGTKLSMDSSKGFMHGIREYAQSRLALLDDRSAGFFEQSPLARQHFVVPKSIYNSSGPQFLADLKAQMASLYPNPAGYEPEIIVYDDLTGSRDFVGQSRAIKSVLEQARVSPGFALVMVHRYERRIRSADQFGRLDS
jgi:hypothetical protein